MLESLAAGEQAQGLAPALAAFLAQRREALLQDWAARVRTQLAPLPTGPPRPLLRELAPGLLEQLAERLGPRAVSAPEPGTAPQDLPGPLLERLAESCEPEALLEELALLRTALLVGLEEAPGPPALRAFTLLNAAFDAELAGLQRRFARARARQQEVLERVLQAAATPGPPAEALLSLLSALTEGTAALDSAAVHLRQREGLHTLSTTGGAVRPGALARQALQEGRALLTLGPLAPQAPPGTRLLLTLPLLQGREALGVLQVGSRSVGALPAAIRRLVERAAPAAGALLARLRLEERLAQHGRDETRLQQQLLVDAAPVALWAMDAQGTVLMSEGRALQNIGLRPGEAVGRSAFEFVQEGRAELETAFRRAMRGESGSYEAAFDGRTHFTRYQPLRGDDGQVQRIICVSVDVTERRRAEQEGALLRMVVEQCSDGIIVVGEDGRLLLGNRQAQRQMGRPIVPMPPERWVQHYGLCDPAGKPARLEELALYRALRGEEVRRNRWHVRRPDGSLRTVVGDASPIRRPDGSLVGAVLTTQDETEREQLEAGLRESEERFRAVFESAAIGIAISDLEGRFLRTNPALQRLTGYSDVELRALRLRDISSPQDLAAERPLLQQLLAGERDTFQVERRFVGKGGQVGACRLTVSLGHGSHAEPRFLIGLVEDLFERRRAEELERAAEFRERFMGILGHDLRNPLNAITLSGRRLLQQPLDAPQARSVHRITHSAERMGRMISDLLDFARARLGGGLPIVRRWVDLHELARNAVDEACAAHPDSRVELSVHGNVWGWWDGDRMAQVLSNLVGNALQYRDPGTPVTVELRDEGPQVRLTVCNHGGVIPDALLPHLFDPFRRGGEAPDGHGHGHNLGLGLFIVKQVVEAHGGRIEVRSDAWQGTAFHVCWPRDPPHETH